MAKRGENIYKRKDGRWEGRYVIGKKENGKTAFAYIYGQKYTEVKKRLEFCKVHREAAENKRLERTVFGDGTIRAWLEYWLEEEVKPEIKQSSYAVYRGQIERHLVPVVGKEPLSQINDQTMEKVHRTMLQKGLSAATALRICKRFQAALASARNADLLGVLPVIPFRKKKGIRQKTRFLKMQEQKLIEQNIDEKNPKDLAVLLSLYSGCRVGECCAFKWEDIDFLAGGIHVTHSLQRVAVYQGDTKKTELLYTDPKSESSERYIPLPSFMMKALERLKKGQKAKEQDYMLGKGGKPVDPRVLQYHVSKLTAALGIRGVHFHTLRHTFATRFMEKNGDVQVLKEVLGHSSSKITMDWYGHTTELHIKKSMQKLKKLAA